MKNRKILIVLFLSIISFNLRAQENQLFFEKANTFFSLYVKDGKVDYAKIHTSPDKLDDLMSLAETAMVNKSNPQVFQAFWINVYNLTVIKGIINYYPVKSPLDISGFFDEITYSIGGKKRTLNEIENKILRSNFPDEPRFHFALVCAGLGCPPIINQAYLPSTLEKQLQKQTELSLNNPKFIRIQDNQVALSQIFEWYEGDFKRNSDSFIDFINAYRKDKIDRDSKVSFYPYDWSLNTLD